jgi:hypothetical protein
MVSSMPASSNAKRRLNAPLALLAATLLLAPAVHAEFRITDVQTKFVNDALLVKGNLELSLSPKVEEALAKGIELPVLIEARLYRKRTLLWDQRLATWLLRRNLQYHALSGQYLVNNGAARENFLSLADALRQLSALGELRLPLSPTVSISNGDEYGVKLRAYLDIEALPAPLRPVAYTTPSWHLNSGWTAWIVSPAAP